MLDIQLKSFRANFVAKSSIVTIVVKALTIDYSSSLDNNQFETKIDIVKRDLKN